MFSIVIPLYNKAHTIVNTLSSVFAQNFNDFEVIIVNDGSTDGSVDAINEKFNDARIKIVNQENAGVSVARNRGIKEAKGEWIAFLDADDEWLPDYLLCVDKAVKSNPTCGIFITARYSQNYKTKQKCSNIPQKYVNKETIVNFFENPHVYAHISATVVKSALLFPEQSWNRFIPGQKYNEDFTFLFRLALHSNVLYIGKPLSIYNGGVEQQATSILKGKQKIKDGAIFRNAVWKEWCNMDCNNKICKIFMKYETRHFILRLLTIRGGGELIRLSEFVEQGI